MVGFSLSLARLLLTFNYTSFKCLQKSSQYLSPFSLLGAVIKIFKYAYKL